MASFIDEDRTPKELSHLPQGHTVGEKTPGLPT